MKIYIKNMVCNRCKMVVNTVLEKLDIRPVLIDLGEVEIATIPSKEQMERLSTSLISFGFELIDDKKSRLIEQIKNIIIKLVHHSKDNITINLSTYIANSLNYDYSYLSNLFSQMESITIEKYIIIQKVEKIKELIVYDELNFSEIAFKLNYSSIAHLSAQFKQVTGFTPSHFKKSNNQIRKAIDQL